MHPLVVLRPVALAKESTQGVTVGAKHSKRSMNTRKQKCTTLK